MLFKSSTKEIDHKSLGKVTVTLEYPQVESLEEASKFAKGDDNLLRLVNGVFKQRALAGPTTAIRKDESPDKEAFASKVPNFQALARNYTPEDSSGVSNKEVVELFNEIKADPSKYASMNVADLLAMLQKK
jgi:hypothetical protein